MSSEKIDFDKLQEQTEFLLKLLQDKDNRGGMGWSQALSVHLRNILELVLSADEVEALKVLGQNKELLEFFVRNKEMLKKTKKIGNVLRTP